MHLPHSNRALIPGVGPSLNSRRVSVSGPCDTTIERRVLFERPCESRSIQRPSAWAPIRLSVGREGPQTRARVQGEGQRDGARLQ